MFVILPLASLIVLVLVFFRSCGCWRKASLSGAAVWGVFVTGTTEILSYLHLLSFIPLLLCWTLLSCGLLYIYFHQKKSYDSLIKLIRANYLFSQDIGLFLKLLIVGIVVIVLTVGLIALVAPPNTWDSMTYHMSRVVHWIQNRSVTHYPTYNLPQLFHPPFAEFAITHLQILSQSDRFANLVQWFAMIGSVIGVSLIAKEFNANLQGQIFAAVFCVTIPMGILQASSTQNDYAVSFWLVCLAYYILQTIKTENRPTIFFFVGSSLGLTLLTKSSGYLYAFPFMVCFSLRQFWRWGWRSWQQIFWTTTIAILLNLNHYLRNFDLFGSIIGAPPNFSEDYKIEVISVPTFISNLLKNLTLHVDIVRYLRLEKFITPITGIVNKLLLQFHEAIGVNMYDPRITDESYRGVPGISFDENIAGNPLHFFIILVLIIVFLLNKQTRKNKLLSIYFIATILGFLSICLLLKIQAYQSRHHLAIIILLSAFVGVVITQITRAKIINILAVLLIVTSLPWVFQNKFHPIVSEANIFNLSRTEQYFINRPQLQEPYTKATNFVLATKCTDVGLSLGKGITVGNEYWEYPFWVLLHQNNQNIRLENVEPQNISSTKSQSNFYKNFTPCAIIAVRNKKDEPLKEIKFRDNTYIEKWSREPVSVLLK
jgi:hypothetical protein